MMKNRIIGLLVVAFGCAFLTGCMTPPKALSDSFSPAGAMGSAPLCDRLMVKEPVEARPNNGNPKMGLHSLVFIPFVPYAATEVTPGTFALGYNFRKDLAVTVADDLRSAGVSRQVAVSGYAFETLTDSPYVLNLTLREGVWNRNVTTYGCSVFGVYIWMFGAPVSYGDVQLAFDAELCAPDGNVIAQERFSGQLGYTENPYKGLQHMERFTELYRQASPQLRNFVARSMRQHQKEGGATAKEPTVKTDKKTGGIAARLKELKELKDAGVLTGKEYESKRKALIAEL